MNVNHPAVDELDLYAAGELEDARARELETHLADCPACAERLRGSRDLVDAIDRAVGEPASLLSASVLAALDRTRRRRFALRAAAAALAALATLGAWVLGRASVEPRPSESAPLPIAGRGEPGAGEAPDRPGPDEAPRGPEDPRRPEGSGPPEIRSAPSVLAGVEHAVEEGNLGAAREGVSTLERDRERAWGALLRGVSAAPAEEAAWPESGPLPPIEALVESAEAASDEGILRLVELVLLHPVTSVRELARELSIDPSASRRIFGLALATELDGPRAAVGFLADPDPALAAAARRAVASAYDPAWAAELASSAESTALRTLRAFPAATLRRDLAARLADRYLPAAERSAAARALGELGDPQDLSLLYAAAAGPDPALAAACRDAAGRLETVDALEILRTLLDDPDPEVRAAAARSLLRLAAATDGPALVARAGAALDARPVDRAFLAALLEGLAEAQVPGGGELVLAASRSDDARVRDCALVAMAAGGLAPWRERCESLLADPDAAVRRRALLSLRLLGRPESALAVLSALRRDDPEFSRLALGAAAELDREKALAAARRLAGSEGSPGWDASADLVARSRDAAGLAELARVAGSGRGVEARVRALSLLAGSEAPGTSEAAEKALRAESPEVRRAALRALSTAGGEETRVRIANALRDPDPSVRIEAARALLALDDVEIVPPLISTLSDPNPDVQRAVVQSLRQATGRILDGEPPLEGSELARAERDWRAWFEAHRRWGRTRWLAEALRSHLPAERRVALAGLSAMGLVPTVAQALPGAESAIEIALPLAGIPWEELLASPEPALRSWAALRLARLGRPEGVSALAKDADTDLTTALALADLDARAAARPLVLHLSRTPGDDRITKALTRATGLEGQDWQEWWRIYGPLYR